MTHRRLLRFMRIAAFAAALALPSARSLASCQIGSVSAVAFGSYDVYSATANAGVGWFSVSNCNSSSRTYTASLSKDSVNNSFSPRIMLNSSNQQLQYNLYKDLPHTQILGDGNSSSFTIVNTNSGSGTGPTHNIYGLIPAGQDAAVGTYSDSITITIRF